MIKVVKIIKDLQARVLALEDQLNQLKQTQGPKKKENSSQLSYEEVIDQWLNGKACN